MATKIKLVQLGRALKKRSDARHFNRRRATAHFILAGSCNLLLQMT